MRILFILSVSLFGLVPTVQGQGLPGTEKLIPSVRGGISAGGPLLPGKNDAERWTFLQSREQSFLGKSRNAIIRIIGKKGSSGLDNNQLIYQVTAGKKKKTGALAHIELAFTFDEDQKCSKYSLVAVNWL